MADYTGDVTISEADAETVVVENPEDVIVERGAVAGDLVIRSAQDVVVKTAGGVRVRDSEDVLVEGTVEGNVRVDAPDDIVDER